MVSSRKAIDGFFYILVILLIIGSIILALVLKDFSPIEAVGAIVLAVIATFTVKKTTDISLRQMELEHEPLISLSIKENDTRIQVIDLIIENLGNGLAKNIQFEVDPPGFITLSGDLLEELYFFKRGLQFLPPRQRYVISLVDFAEKISKIREREGFPIDDNQLTPSEGQRFRRIVRDESEFHITLHYEDREGREKFSPFAFNLCVFWGLRIPRQTVSGNIENATP